MDTLKHLVNEGSDVNSKDDDGVSITFLSNAFTILSKIAIN